MNKNDCVISVRELIDKNLDEVSALFRQAHRERTTAIIRADRAGLSAAEQTITNLRFVAFNHLHYAGRVPGDR